MSRTEVKAPEMGLLAHEKAPHDPPRFRKGCYQINWVSTIIVCAPTIMSAAAYIAGVPVEAKTMWVLFAFYLFSGFGITAGHHRYFAHRAFNATPLLQWIMAIAGAAAFQGSAKWWCRNHRIHHRYIDTDKDPYNAKRGFFYSHIGWMLMKQDYSILGRVDISDLNCSPVVRFQHNHYLPLATFVGIVLPTLICGLGWGDWLGGYFYAALLKMTVLHHTTFFINSLAHSKFFGATQNFSEEHTSQDSLVCALVTLGEGYHNFHHEFAQDYRNGVKWYHFDPTKWLIRSFEFLGLARGLVRTPQDLIDKNFCQVKHNQHERAVAEFNKRLDALERKTCVPCQDVWTWTEVNDRVAKGAKLMVVGNYVLDLTKTIPTGSGYTHGSKNINWYDAHPGGRKMLDMFVGRDASEAFSGGIYKHSLGATNLLSFLRVALIKKESM